MHLFAKNHVDFHECCFDAQNFDENCELLHSKPKQDSIESGESSKNMDFHALVDLILQKLRQELKLTQPSHTFDMRLPNQVQMKWCEFCRICTNHEMLECHHRIRFLREGNYQLAQQSIVPGIMSLRYAEKEQNERNLAVVPIESYYIRDGHCPNNASNNHSKRIFT